MSKKEIGLCFDVGSAYLAVAVFDGQKWSSVISPTCGAQTPTVIFIDAKGKEHFGTDAYLHSSGKGQLYMHAKRYMYEQAEEKVFGEFTPVDLMSKMVGYGVKLLLAARPELKSFEQFGGSRPAEQLGIWLWRSL